MENLFPFVLIALAALLLFVLPARQRKRMQAQAKALQESLTVGAPVMTTSGMHGTVVALGDSTLDLEIAPGVVVTFARPAVLEVRKPAVDALDAVDGSSADGGISDSTGGRPADDTR